MTIEEVIKEARRLRDWWLNDAAYRPPEDPLQAYALGEANAYEKILLMLKEIPK
jgi:hypothetical protein